MPLHSDYSAGGDRSFSRYSPVAPIERVRAVSENTVMTEGDGWPNHDGDETEEETNHSDEHELPFQERCVQFVQATTFHGFDQIFTSVNACARVFWLTTMVLVFVIVTYQLRNLIAYFISNPTLTSISVNYPKEGLQMPSITVCPLAKLNKTAVSEKFAALNKVQTEFGTSSFFSSYSTALVDTEYFNSTGFVFAELQKQFDDGLNGTDFMQFIEDTVFTCRGQFLSCWFENGRLWDCCGGSGTNPFFYIRRAIIHSGPCFEFVFTENATQKLPGPVGGFGFIYIYPNKHILKSAFNAYDEHAVHLYTSMADAMLEKNPTVLPVGYHNHISLQATKTTKLTKDLLGRETCVLPELKYFVNYTYPNCQVECLIDSMLAHCNCTGIFTYANIPRDRVCEPEPALNCYRLLVMEYKNLLVQCRNEKCRESCTYWEYRPTLTVGKVFNPVLEDEMTKYWRLPIATHEVSQSLLLGDVYFDEIMFTGIEQQPALTLETFISSIGGAMGLWTGASIITWIHLIFFFVTQLRRRRRKMKEKKRKASREQHRKRSMWEEQQRAEALMQLERSQLTTSV